MNFTQLERKVIDWAAARGITDNGKPMGQALKTLEETGELLDALNRHAMSEVQDAIGDIVVTLIVNCTIMGITLTECLETAYAEIKDRKGYLTPEGVFVKEAT